MFPSISFCGWSDAGERVREQAFVPAEGRLAATEPVQHTESRVNAEKKNPMIEPTEETCAICLSDLFEPGEEVVRLNCKSEHVFHKQCIREWLKNHDTCPLDNQKGVSILDGVIQRCVVNYAENTELLELVTNATQPRNAGLMRWVASESVAPIDDQVLAQIRDQCESANPATRQATADLLSGRVGPVADELLLQLLCDRQQPIRSSVLAAVSLERGRTISEDGYQATLRRIVSARGTALNLQELAKGLLYFQGHSADQLLLHLVCFDDADVREAALDVIATNANRSISEPAQASLSRIIRYCPSRVQRHLAAALGYYRGPLADTYLLRSASGRDAYQRMAALAALGRAEGGRELNAHQQNWVQSCLNRGSQWEQIDLAKALQFYAGPIVDSTLLQLLGSRTSFQLRQEIIAVIGTRNDRELSVDLNPWIQVYAKKSSTYGLQDLVAALEFYIGSNVDSFLLQFVGVADLRVREKAVAVIATREGRQLGERLQNWLRCNIEKDCTLTRLDLAKALQFYGGPLADGALLELAAAEDLLVREKALSVIRKQPNRELGVRQQGRIFKCLSKGSERALCSLAVSLQFYNGEIADATLQQLANHECKAVRDKALNVIQRRKWPWF